MSGKTIRTSADKIDALQLQSSTRGACVPYVRGVTTVPCNLVWYNGFKAVPHTESQGGKGGAGKSENTTFTYEVDHIMGVCRGPIIDIPRAFVGKKQYIGGVTGSQVNTGPAESYTPPASGAMTYTLAHASAFLCMVGVTRTDGAATQLLAMGQHYGVTGSGVLTVLDESLRGVPLSITYQWRASNINRQAMAQLGLSFYAGHIGQGMWSGLAGYPSEQFNYSGLAFVAGQKYSLGESAQIENHRFEVVAPLAYHLGSTVPDVDPAQFLRELLIDQQDGAGLPPKYLGDWQRWSDFCVSAGMLVSPALTEQTTAADIIKQAADLTISAISTSGGKLQIIPRADSPESGLGRTYTPNLTPVYDLDDEAYTPSRSGESPVKYRNKSNATRYNTWSLEYRNRANNYAPEPVDDRDSTDIAERGVRANPSAVQAHWICNTSTAAKAVKLMMQRSVSVLSEYEVPLPPHFSLIDLGDILTLSDPSLMMDKTPVFVIGIDEDDSGNLRVLTEDYPIGSASAPTFSAPESIGFQPDYNVAPGNTDTPVIIEAPAQLAGTTGVEVYIAVRGIGQNWGGCQVWTSLDGSNYKQVSTIYGPSRYGALSAALSAGATSAQVDGLGDAELTSGSATDAQQLQTLCFIGGPQGEFVAHQAATLTGAGAYTLGGLVRAAYGSPNAAHPDNAVFVRLDERIASSGPLDPTMVGQVLYVKCPSFNIYQGAQQSLADVDATTYTITGQPASYNPGVAGKGVSLRASSYFFHLPKSGGSPTPGSITLTAERKGGLLGAATFSVIAGSAVLVGSGDSRTLAASDMSTDSITVRVSISDGVATYLAEVTMIKVREGLDGAPGAAGNYIDHIFTRSASQPATPTGTGTPSGWYDAPPAGSNPLWMSVAEKSATGALVVPWGTPARLDGQPGSDGQSVSVEYSVDGSSSWHSTFTTGDKFMRQRIGAGSWSAAIKIVGEDGAQGPQGLPGANGAPGAPGASAPLLVLLATAQTFAYDSAGSPKPAGQTITLTAALQNVSGTATFTARLYNAAGTDIGALSLGGSGNTRTIAIADFGSAASASITATLSGLSDTTSIVRVQDGANGANGANGAPGANGQDAIVSDLTNDSHTLPATSAGVVTSYDGAATAMVVYRGTTADTANWSFSKADGPNVTSTISGNVVTITNIASAVDSGYVDITATRSGYPTQTKRFTLAKSRSSAGAAGVLAGWFVAAGDHDDTFPYSMSASVTLSDNGVISTTGDSPINSAWYAPATTGIGSSHWVKFTLLSGNTPSGAALNSWLPLSTARTLSLSGSVNSECQVTARIATDSAGSNVVGSGTIDINISNSL